MKPIDSIFLVLAIVLMAIALTGDKLFNFISS